MSRTGENIYKRRDGRWEGRYMKFRNTNGKPHYGYVYAKTYQDVKIKLIKALYENVKKTEYLKRDSEKMIFREFCEMWLESIQVQVKESTHVKYKNMLSSYVYPQLGNLEITSISYYDLESMVQYLLLRGGNKQSSLSPKTVGDVMSILRRIFQYASNKEIDVKCNASSIIVKQTPAELYIMPHNEQSILTEYLLANANPRNLGVLISLFTGIRIGELCALKWGDISISQKVIRIHCTMQRIQSGQDECRKTKIIITEPKSTRSIRMIPIPECILEILAEFQVDSEAFLLTGSIADFVEPRTLENHWKRVLKACGLKQMKFHTLRHTFATRCIELGFDVKSLSEILGHASVNITLNRYVHPSMKVKKENMDRLSLLFTVK